MLNQKSKDSADVFAAVENAPEIIEVSSATATQCVKNCDQDDAPVALCDIDNLNVEVAALCDIDNLNVEAAALCDLVGNDRVAAACDL